MDLDNRDCNHHALNASMTNIDAIPVQRTGTIDDASSRCDARRVATPSLRTMRGQTTTTLAELYRASDVGCIHDDGATESATSHVSSTGRGHVAPKIASWSSSTTEMTTSPRLFSSSLGAMRRAGKRISFGRNTPALSSPSISSPVSTASPGTPGLATLGFPAPESSQQQQTLRESLSTSKISRVGSLKQAITGRRRSGSCRADQRFGNRPKPTVLSCVNDEDWKSSLDYSASANMPWPAAEDRDKTPQRPRNPAPPLNLSYDHGSIGSIIFGDRETDSIPSLQGTPKATGLGLSTTDARLEGSTLLSAIRPASRPQGKRRSISVVGHRFGGSSLPPRRASEESFHCCGVSSNDACGISRETQYDRESFFDAVDDVDFSSVTPSQRHTMLLQPEQPGSPLQQRRRPWPLSEQLAAQATIPFAKAIPPRKSSKAAYKAWQKLLMDEHAESVNDGTRDEHVNLVSRFSSVSELETVSDNAPGAGTVPSTSSLEPSEASCRGVPSWPASTESTWASSLCSSSSPQANWSPEARTSQSFASKENETTERIEDEDELNRDALTALPPELRPSATQRSISLRLVLPPSAIAKFTSLAGQQLVSMETSASILELKEHICASLLTAHGLSISPSQLGLSVFDVTSPPSRTTRTASGSANRPSDGCTESMGSSKYATWGTGRERQVLERQGSTSSRSLSALRQYAKHQRRRMSMSRLSSTVSSHGATSPRLGMERSSPDGDGITQSDSTSSSSSATVQGQAAASLVEQTHMMRLSSLRTLPNESILFQEGLQDNDVLIVRF